MWLVQLHKAKQDAPIESVHSTTNWNDAYIYPDPYVPYALNLYNNWNYDYATKKRILIIKKKPEEITIAPLQNERFMFYRYMAKYNSSDIFPPDIYSQIISLEYLVNEEFFLEFYSNKFIVVIFDIPPEITSAPNLALSLLQYIRGKTLNIGIIGNRIPKYSIAFDDNCKYYYYDGFDEDEIFVLALKNPFLIIMITSPVSGNLTIYIAMKPRLIEEFNNESTYSPDDDQPLRVNDIISQYFNSDNKTGLSHDFNVNNDNINSFNYNLIKSLLAILKNGISDRYYFSLDDNLGSLYETPEIYRALAEIPVCIYFPLFRPQLDDNGFNMILPQYDPNDTSKYVRQFYFILHLQNNGEVNYCVTDVLRSGDPYDFCRIFRQGHMPSWRSNTCDLTRPFRFVGAANCEATDDWVINTATHNANYLFLITKSTFSNSYKIKGIGCNELITDVYRFDNFNSDYMFGNDIALTDNPTIYRFNFSASGYPTNEISTTLASYGAVNNETCFVLLNDSLLEDMSDFTTIYQALTAPLPNAIVCYIGDSEKIPDTYKNKVIHSDAIVTDLSTNEQMPLVIKYIRYAKRLHNLFNE
jgi:hypothetical protein